MRKLFLIFLVIGSLFGRGIDYSTSYENALKRAKVENKNIMVVVERAGCPYCVKFNRDILGNSAIREALRNYIVVKLDSSNWEVYRYFREDRRVTPTVYFLNSNGRILLKINGYIPPSSFLSYLKSL